MTATTKSRIATAVQILAALALIIGSFAWLTGPSAEAVTDNACEGAFAGASDEGIELTILDANGAALGDGAEITIGDTLTAVITWNPDYWTDVARVAHCVELAGTVDLSLSEEEKPAVNDGEFTTTFVVPSLPGVELCSRARLSGQPSGENPSDDTHKSDALCFDIVAASPVAPTATHSEECAVVTVTITANDYTGTFDILNGTTVVHDDVPAGDHDVNVTAGEDYSITVERTDTGETIATLTGTAEDCSQPTAPTATHSEECAVVTVTITANDYTGTFDILNGTTVVHDDVPAGDHDVNVTAGEDYSITVERTDTGETIATLTGTAEDCSEPVCVGGIVVRVYEDGTTDPIEDVTVTIDGDSGTAPFTVTELDCDTYPTTIDDDTLPEGWTLVGPDSQNATVVNGEITEVVYFAAPPAPVVCLGTIIVQVVDDEGNPVDEVTVMVEGTEGEAPLTVDNLECDTYSTSIDTDTIPEDFALVGDDSQDATISRHGETVVVTYVISDEVSVLPGVIERDEPGDEQQPAPDVADDQAPAPDDDDDLAEVDELALTGLDSAGLAALALALVAAGVAAGRIGRRREQEV